MRFSALTSRTAFVLAVLIVFPIIISADEEIVPGAIKEPVLLVHGLGEDGSGWGLLQQLLEDDGYQVFIIDFNKFPDLYDPKKSEQRIEDMVTLLSRTIIGITNKTGIPQINIIAHSYGGVIVRAYIAGWGSVVDQAFDYADNIHSIVYVSVPGYGIEKKKSRLSGLIDLTEYGPFKEKKSIQGMLEWYGDGILDLALWFRDFGPTRGVASLSLSSEDDAVVDNYSASLDGELPPYVISHHVNLAGYSHCAPEAARTGLPSIIDVTDNKHPVYKAATSFFGGTKLWLKIGNPVPISPGYVILDLVPSENFNPTKLGKKAVKLMAVDDDGNKKKVKLKQTSAKMFYARDVQDGKYSIVVPFENKKQAFNIEIDTRNSATSIVKFDPANPPDDDGDGEDPDDGLNLPDEVKDVGSLTRFIRNYFGEERMEALLGPVEMIEFTRQIRDALADRYPEIELLNNQFARFGYGAPHERHHDAFYYVPTNDVIDFVRASTDGGVLIEKLSWSRVPTPW